MHDSIRIGTRDSRLAIWQAQQVMGLLAGEGYSSQLVYIRSEGDEDLQTPLYAMGVQGIFTRALDSALLNDRIDLAVHSMKDVPLQLAKGLQEAAILKRGPVEDLLVYKKDLGFLDRPEGLADIATGSIRRRAQWLNKYPGHRLHGLRGNIDTRIKKFDSANWDGALFARAGLERIGLASQNTLILEWMVPAPAQGAIIILCRQQDQALLAACRHFHDHRTVICTGIEREFLGTLLGGCSTPISALAQVEGNQLRFRGNIVSPDGSRKAAIEKIMPFDSAAGSGRLAAEELLNNGGMQIADKIRHAIR